MNRDDRIPFERVLMLCALGFLLGILFGCTPPTAVTCRITGADTSRALVGTDSMTVIVTSRWCQ